MPTKTLTERIFAMNIIKTGREARLLINSGRVCVDNFIVTNEDYLVSDAEEVTVLPKPSDKTIKLALELLKLSSKIEK